MPIQMAFAHRGASNEIDRCRIKVGFEKIHFSAYTPLQTGSKTYCDKIPGVGPTNLVFDYEGKKLRNVTIEFEITKEPGGTRIFYQEPKKIRTGNVNGQVDFSQYGAGDYLAHITIINKDKKLDTHLPFKVGVEPDNPISNFMIFLISSGILILMILGVKYLTKTSNEQDKSDES